MCWIYLSYCDTMIVLAFVWKLVGLWFSILKLFQSKPGMIFCFPQYFVLVDEWKLGNNNFKLWVSLVTAKLSKLNILKTFLHGNLNDIKNGFMFITYVKGKVLSWVFKNEKYMWMVGERKEQGWIFSGDGNVLYLDSYRGLWIKTWIVHLIAAFHHIQILHKNAFWTITMWTSSSFS